MKPPTHAAVSQRAHQLWQDEGRPAGRATSNWLDAERKLTPEFGRAAPTAAGDAPAHNTTGAAAMAESPRASTVPTEAAGKTSAQVHAARDPQRPTKLAPKAAPPESGKPLWNQPHSS